MRLLIKPYSAQSHVQASLIAKEQAVHNSTMSYGILDVGPAISCVVSHYMTTSC